MSSISNILLFLTTLSQLTQMARSKPETYIIGGSAADPGAFPYFVQMDSCGGCGGALIAPDTVLFAAHCPTYVGRQVIIGAYEPLSLNHGAQARFCEKWEAHPGWATSIGFDLDFALCKLDSPVTIDESKVKLVWNEDPNIPADKDDLITMGFGFVEEGFFGCPEYLQNVTVPYVNNTRCNRTEMYDGEITDQMLCAGFVEGGKDACQGDSGGPIVKRVAQGDGSFIDYHVGVVSWGYGCARPNKPGVYARTSSAYDFIKETVCNDFNSVASFCDNGPTSPVTCEEAQLDIVVKTDNYPEESSWSLYEQASGEEIMSREYLISNNKNEHQVCLDKNSCYNFTMFDSYGDGLCFEGVCGLYELSLSGKEESFASGSDFQYSESTEFCVDDAGNVVDELSVICKDDKRWKSPGGKTCRSVRKKKTRKAKRICKEKVTKSSIVADFCLRTCGKLGVGECDHLKDE